MRICSNTKKCRFPGGFFQAQKTIFDELEDFGVFVPENLRLYPYFAVFDFEAMLKKTEDRVSEKLEFTHYHKPISVSLNSNVDGYTEPIHHVSANLDVLLKSMLESLTEIARAAEAKTREKLSFVFDILNERMSKCAPAADLTPTSITTREVESVGYDHDDDDDDDDINDAITCEDLAFIDDASAIENHTYENPYLHQQQPLLQQQQQQQELAVWSTSDQSSREMNVKRTCIEYGALKRLQKKLSTYCVRLPVLGFNSAKYDLNLVKGSFLKHLNLTPKNGDYVIKRANSYLCIASEHFKFLDITSYLAAGASYSKFLKAYGVTEEKGFFPYEWFDCEEKLNYPDLPAYENFFSNLKNHNVLDPDCTGVGVENYEFMKSEWSRYSMQSFADFLRHYNNSDVIGFVKAVDTMLKFYFENQIDLFKDTISLPNLARKELFKCSSRVFPLFDPETQDIYRTVQQNIVGGPSIIFKREACANETLIRGQKNVVGKRVLGHDANGLYAYCIAQPMPTGCFVDRRVENSFKGIFREKYFNMYFWLDHVAECENIKIRHRLNNGKEVRIGPYCVDGFCAETNTVYEYNGCWHHFCSDCQHASSNADVFRRQQRARARTEEKREYLISRDYNLVEMKECHFKQHILEHTQHIQSRYLPSFFSRIVAS